MSRPRLTRRPHTSNTPARILSVLAAVLCLAASHAVAEWSVVSTKSLGSPAPGIEVLQTECENAGNTARVTAIVFNEKSHTLRVVDSPSPGSAILENTLRHEGIPAGVNGGFFHPDFKPAGLVISDGKTLHPYEKARLLAGIFGATKDGRITIIRSTAHRAKPTIFTNAIQCGPMLVEKGVSVVGLKTSKPARRTAAAIGPDGLAALVYITSVTLEEAGQILALPRIFGSWSPTTALNLDGGTSSGLWAEDIISLPEIKRVRNFIGIVPRD